MREKISDLQEIILLADSRSGLYARHKITDRCEKDADLQEIILFDALQPVSLLRGSPGSSNVTLLARLDTTGNPGNGAGPRFNNNGEPPGLYENQQ